MHYGPDLSFETLLTLENKSSKGSLHAGIVISVYSFRGFLYFKISLCKNNYHETPKRTLTYLCSGKQSILNYEI